MKFLVLLVILAVNLELAVGWGEIGHKITASIAQSYLKKTTLDNLNKILQAYTGPNGQKFTNIIDISTYADVIRPQTPWSSAFHYVNMDPAVSKYNEAAQCPSPAYCIVKALQNYTAILKDRTNTNLQAKGEALFFTIHLFGDLYQPLHVGNPADSGGNGIKLTLSSAWKVTSKPTNLHAAWDTSFLQHWMSSEGNPGDLNYAYVKFLSFIEADQVFKNEYLGKSPNLITITEETRVVCMNEVYATVPNYVMTSLSIDYYTKYWPTVRRQVMKSGLQMSRLLNDMLDYVGKDSQLFRLLAGSK